MKEKISLAMVVKDEASTLDRAVSSVFDIIDEVVIGVDNSSSDNSLKIAKKWVKLKGSGKAFEFKWQDSFADARNLVISRCSNPWIFILDGHEYVSESSISHFDKIFEVSKKENPSVFAFLIYMKDTPGQSQALQHRLFKNYYRYSGDIHNTISLQKNDTSVGYNAIVIVHDRPSELAEIRSSQRREMYERKFKKELEENPDSARANYYMGIWCSNGREFKKAVNYFDKYLENSDLSIERSKVYCFAGMALRELGEEDKSVRYFKSAIAERYDCADGYIELGDLAVRRISEDKDNLRWYSKQAEFYYKCATALEMPIDSIFLDRDSYTWKGWVKLASLYEQMINDYDQFHVTDSLIRCAHTALSFDNMPEDIRKEVSVLYNTFLSIYKKAVEEIKQTDKKVISETGPILAKTRVT
jgi:tetratricopeptide (TPR) repeat protein